MKNINLTSHDAHVAAKLHRLWIDQLEPLMTQDDFAEKYEFVQNYLPQVFYFHSKVSHSLICAFAKELSISPLAIDREFHEPSRFRRKGEKE